MGWLVGPHEQWRNGNSMRQALSVTVIAAALFLAGCTTVVPQHHSSATSKATVHEMTPAESKAEVMDLYDATTKLVGGNWSLEGDWSDCTPEGGKAHAYFDLGAQRRAQPLQAEPDVVVKQVQELWASKGHRVKVVSEPTLTPPRLILSDPAWLSGSYPDGRLFQFSVGKDYADFSATGRCVPGDSYYLNTGKHL